MTTYSQPRPRRPVWPWILAAVLVLGAAVALAVALLAGDGNDGQAAGQPTPTATTAPKEKEAVALRVADLTKQLGCEHEKRPAQLFSKETGWCTLEGAELVIATFSGEEQRDSWVEVANQMGGTIVTGPNWAIAVPDPDVAVTVADKLGGNIL